MTSGEVIRKVLRGEMTSEAGAVELQRLERESLERKRENLRPRHVPRWLWVIVFALFLVPFHSDSA